MRKLQLCSPRLSLTPAPLSPRLRSSLWSKPNQQLKPKSNKVRHRQLLAKSSSSLPHTKQTNPQPLNQNQSLKLSNSPWPQRLFRLLKINQAKSQLKKTSRQRRLKCSTCSSQAH